MADQDIEALMGLIEPGAPGESALANTLRGQQQMGQFYGLSPTLQKHGEGMQTRALRTAEVAGNRRQQGLQRARQAEQDARQVEQDEFAREKYEQTLKGYSDTEWVVQDGESMQIGTNNKTGAREIVPGTEGMKPHQKKYGSSVFRSINVPGLKEAGFRVDDEGRIMAPDGKIYDTHDEFKAAFPDLAQTALDNIHAKEFTKGIASGTADEVTDLRTGLAATNGAYSTSEANMHGIVNAIDKGANPGQVFALLPTLTNPTSLLESIISKESLDLLNTYQLKPVSDKDMAVLRQVAAPNMDATGLRAWAVNKIAVLKRAQAAGRVFEEWVAAKNRVPRGAERDALQAEMFKAADAAAADPGAVDPSAPPAAEQSGILESDGWVVEPVE